MSLAKRKETIFVVITLATIAFALYTQVIWAIVASDRAMLHKDTFNYS